MYLLNYLLIGLAAGFLGGLLMKGRGFGLTGNTIVGAIGALLGGILSQLLGLAVNNLAGALVAAVLGAVLLLSIVAAFRPAA